MLYGKYYGAGGAMDIYYAYNSIPNIIIGVLPVVFSSLLIPLFPQYESKGQLEEFMVSINRKVLPTSISLVIVALAACLIKIFFSKSTSALLEVKICVVIWTAAFFSIMNAFYVSYVNYRKKFIQVSLTSLMTYTSILLMVVLFHSYFGVVAIVLGLLLGALIRFATMRNIMKLPHSRFQNNMVFKGIMKRALLVFATLLPFSAFPAIAYMWAGNMEEGAVSYLGYSHSFEGALSVAGSMGIATVSFPDLAKSLNTSDRLEIVRTLTKYTSTLKAVFFFSCLIICFCCVFIEPISSLLLERGEFTSYNIKKLSMVLPLYFVSGGIIAELNLIRNIFYSLKELRVFSIISITVTALFLLLALLLGNGVSYVVVGITECSLWGVLFILSLKILVTKTGDFIQKNVYFDAIKYFTIPLGIAFVLKPIYDCFLSQYGKMVGIFFLGVLYVFLSLVLLAYVFKAKEVCIMTDKLKNIIKSKK